LKSQGLEDRSFRMNGERGRNRTFNLLIKSQLLCQLSYAPVPAGCPAAAYILSLA
jgi:hypothetical protein